MPNTTLIVGLGNPGPKYEHSRHNVGFDVLAFLSAKLSCPIRKTKCRALVGECGLGPHRVILAAPQTYMNLSGEAVQALLRWYRVEPARLLVIYDDVDLPPGVLRIRREGSAGTHNGMRSIIGCLGTQNFPRIRVGVGGCPPEYDLADWVLSHYNTKEERQVAYDAYSLAAEAAIAFVETGIESAMLRYNPKKAPKPPAPAPQAILPKEEGDTP